MSQQIVGLSFLGCRLLSLEEQYRKEKLEADRKFEKLRVDYEAKIECLQKQVDAQSMMSSMYSSYLMTPDRDFDDYGKTFRVFKNKNKIHLFIIGNKGTIFSLSTTIISWKKIKIHLLIIGNKGTIFSLSMTIISWKKIKIPFRLHIFCRLRWTLWGFFKNHPWYMGISASFSHLKLGQFYQIFFFFFFLKNGKMGWVRLIFQWIPVCGRRKKCKSAERRGKSGSPTNSPLYG